MLDFRTIALALLAINGLTFMIYWHDKRCARKGSWRVPENILLGLALIGGSPTAFFSMRLLRHKTKKSGFRTRYWLIVALQCVILIYGFIHGFDSLKAWQQSHHDTFNHLYKNN